MNGLPIRNEAIEFEDWLIVLKDAMEHTSNEWIKFERSQHVTSWTLETLGFQPIMPKDLPGHYWDGKEGIAFIER